MDEEPHAHHWFVYGDHGEARCECGAERVFRNYRWAVDIPDGWSWNSAVYGGPRLQLPVKDDEE